MMLSAHRTEAENLKLWFGVSEDDRLRRQPEWQEAEKRNPIKEGAVAEGLPKHTFKPCPNP